MPHGPSGTPTPPWLFLLLVCLFGLIFYLFVPKTEVQVRYYPWFLEQVDTDNIKSITIQGTEIRGVLRSERPHQRLSSQAPVSVKWFVTAAPSEISIDPIVEKLIERNEQKTAAQKKAGDLIEIEALAPNSVSGVVWMTVFLPAFLVIVFLYVSMRRARHQFRGGTRRVESETDAEASLAGN
jgi:cell division protease FtsH